MSSGMSSDQIVKNEIKDKVKRFEGIVLRIFPDSSNEDQRPVEEGGLTFSYNGVNYGSCDAGWFEKKEIDGNIVEIPLIGLEGTDALNRGSTGNAQYQRFHHALGAVKNGYIGIYYLRKGDSIVQPDLFEMAYNATIHEPGEGAYLIIQDLNIVNDILELIVKYGRASEQVNQYLKDYAEKMHKYWYENKFKQYDYNWDIFADKRSTILNDDYIIKYAGRMKRNYTDGSQRAGHIAVGEMYLSKYLFYGKKVYYLCPRMNSEEVAYLDKHKADDKEWHLLRHEDNVFYVTRDDLENVPSEVISKLVAISDSPMKGRVLSIFKECMDIIKHGLIDGSIKLKR